MASYSYPLSYQNTSSTQTTAPSWQPQVGALTNAFNGANGLMQSQAAQGPYMGDYYAAANPQQYGAYNQAVNFGQGNASNVGNAQINQGLPMMAQGYGGASSAMGSLYNFGNSNQTQNNINTANQYAEDPWITDEVKAATANANRNAAENDIPNIYRSAAGSGNLNSDRAAMAQGIVERGLGENSQNIYAKMRGDAWNTGLNTALTQNQQNLGALSNAGSMGMGIGNAGSENLGAGINNQTNLSNLYSTGANGLQSLAQNGINNSLAKYQGQRADQWSPYQQGMGIFGTNNWGSTTNSNSTSTGFSPVQNQQSPGALSYLGAGLGVAGSIAGLALGGPAGAAAGGTVGGALAKYMAPSVFGKPA